jgi:hypothetical protein
MKSWFISSGLIFLSFSERSLKLLTQDFINTCTSDLCHLFISAAKNTFGTRSVYKGKPNIVKGDTPWFNFILSLTTLEGSVSNLYISRDDLFQRTLGVDKKVAKTKLFEMFPYGYVKQTCKIAGMRRPTTF